MVVVFGNDYSVGSGGSLNDASNGVWSDRFRGNCSGSCSDACSNALSSALVVVLAAVVK